MAKKKEAEEGGGFVSSLAGRYGKEVALSLFGDEKERDPSLFVNTGSRLLNLRITGDDRCGYPRGRITEIYGPEGSGKTTLALEACAQVNKGGHKAVYFDLEHALDRGYAKALGVDPELTGVIQPGCGEEAFEIMQDIVDDLAEKDDISLVVVDSVAAVTPRAEIDGTMDESHMGLHARIMGRALRKLVGRFYKKKVTAIFINQIRMQMGQYGNPETTTGGKALKFFSFVRMETRAPRSGAFSESRGSMEDVIKAEEGAEKKKKKGVEVGTEMRIKTVKNKIFPPYATCELVLRYGEGIDKTEDLLRFLEAAGAIAREGGLVTLKGLKRTTEAKFLEAFNGDKEFRAKVRAEVENAKNKDG